MAQDRKSRSLERIVAATAVAFGLAVGSYGIASAASGSGSSSSAATTTTTTTTAPSTAPTAPPAGYGQGGPGGNGPWGGRRSDETLLTGDTADKVKAAALDKLSGATIVRVETDADGNAKYEAHMTKADGTPVTVYVDESFDVVGVETR
jgi:hypothetical protein